MVVVPGRPPTSRGSRIAAWAYVIIESTTVPLILLHDNYISRGLPCLLGGNATPCGSYALIVFLISCLASNILYYQLFSSDSGYVKVDSNPNLTPEQKADPVRYCGVCSSVRPMRSRHCYQCNRCVSKYDHHCIWIGACVGELNHVYFWWFLFWAHIMVLFASTGLYFSLPSDRSSSNPSGSGTVSALIGSSSFSFLDGTSSFVWRTLLPMMMFVVVAMLVLYTGTLLICHTFIALTNQTTYEWMVRYKVPYLKNLPSHILPFDEGIVLNLAYFFCFSRKLFPRQWSYVEDSFASTSGLGCCNCEMICTCCCV